MSDIPRRNDLLRNETSEKAIYLAIIEVEKLGANEMLTDAVTLLSEAKNLVGDFIDRKEKDAL